MKSIDGLLGNLSRMCGCMVISDLRFEPYKTRAKEVLEHDSSFSLRYSPEQLMEAKEYVCS
ncbi:MAG: hypothetical protein Q4C46_07250 [Bacillota bacterium]|nr:hypothetical protein [Bacillota bacterium]